MIVNYDNDENKNLNEKENYRGEKREKRKIKPQTDT